MWDHNHTVLTKMGCQLRCFWRWRSPIMCPTLQLSSSHVPIASQSKVITSRANFNLPKSYKSQVAWLVHVGVMYPAVCNVFRSAYSCANSFSTFFKPSEDSCNSLLCSCGMAFNFWKWVDPRKGSPTLTTYAIKSSAKDDVAPTKTSRFKNCSLRWSESRAR